LVLEYSENKREASTANRINKHTMLGVKKYPGEQEIK